MSTNAFRTMVGEGYVKKGIFIKKRLKINLYNFNQRYYDCYLTKTFLSRDLYLYLMTTL